MLPAARACAALVTALAVADPDAAAAAAEWLRDLIAAAMEPCTPEDEYTLVSELTALLSSRRLVRALVEMQLRNPTGGAELHPVGFVRLPLFQYRSQDSMHRLFEIRLHLWNAGDADKANWPLEDQTRAHEDAHDHRVVFGTGCLSGGYTNRVLGPPSAAAAARASSSSSEELYGAVAQKSRSGEFELQPAVGGPTRLYRLTDFEFAPNQLYVFPADHLHRVECVKAGSVTLTFRSVERGKSKSLMFSQKSQLEDAAPRKSTKLIASETQACLREVLRRLDQ